MVTARRGPIAEIFPAESSTTASAIGGPPVPSMTVPPTIAVVPGAVCADNRRHIKATDANVAHVFSSGMG
jgi:hypothetical protein